MFQGAQAAPKITESSKEVEVVEGSTVTIECRSQEAENSTVTWFKEDKQLEENPRISTTVEDGVCSLKIKKVTLDDEADYTCEITTDLGTATMTTELIVEECVSMPIFKEQLTTQQVNEQSIVHFNVRVAGYPQPVIEWFKDGQQLEDIGRVIIIDDVDDKEPELFSLVVEDCKLDDAGEYTCIAMNEAGKSTSTCILSVLPLAGSPTITESEETPVEIMEGQDLTLKVEISGAPTPDVEWYKDDKCITKKETYTIDDSGNEHFLTISEATPDDEGVYKCVSKSKDEIITRSFKVYVEGKQREYICIIIILMCIVF